MLNFMKFPNGLLFAALVILILCDFSFAYDDETVHRQINESAVKRSDFYLGDKIESVGFSTSEEKDKVVTWLSNGGRDEDNPDWRVLTHFHDPLEPWATAGYTDMSALVWAQDQWSNGFDWSDARDSYYQALTTGKEAEFAKTFTILGHVMHLVSDMAVPAHVRPDYHLTDPPLVFFFLKEDPDGYEEYTARSNVYTKLDYKGIVVDPSIFSRAVASPGAYAPVPISALWDQNRYERPTLDRSATVASEHAGLAEYTNANFFSKDTIGDYENPPAGVETWQTVIYEEPEVITGDDKKVDYRVYLYGDAGGGVTIRKAGISLFDLDAKKQNIPPKWMLDDTVHKDYASLLIPAAVGYSTALVDYFFRGKIEVTIPENGFKASNLDNGGFNSVTLLAMNATENNEELAAGSVDLMVRYRPADEDQYPVYSKYKYVRAYPVSQVEIPTGTAKEFTFDLTESIPFNAQEITCFLVYKGDIGEELDNAVAVGKSEAYAPNQLEISLPDAGYYAHLANYPDPMADSGFSQIHINSKSLGTSFTGGDLKVEVKYLNAVGDPFTNSYYEPGIISPIAKEDFVFQKSAGTISLAANDIPADLVFNLANQVPLRSSDVYLYLYYRDAAGNVSVGFKDISEPTPVDLLNTGHHVCVDGVFYPAGSAAAVSAAVSYSNADVSPHDMEEIRIWYISPQQQSPGVEPDYSLARSNRGDYERLGYILTDPEYFNFVRGGYYLILPQKERNDEDYMGSKKFSGRSAKNQLQFSTDPLDCGQDANGNAKEYCHTWKWKKYETIRSNQVESIAQVWIVNPEYSIGIRCPYEYFFE